MGERKRMTYGFTEFELADAWNSSSSTQEVANKLTALCRQKGRIGNEVSVPKTIVLARASTYRKAGAKLKNFERITKRKLDINALNKHIENQAQS